MADAVQILKRYDKAKARRQQWENLYEECYQYALPNRESFYHETQAERRDDLIFDETAVVGTQEFASRLQAGIVPNWSRWSDFVAGSEVEPENVDAVNNALEEVTQYVFEILHSSNFSQEIHESFMDLAVGTGVLCVEEGDAVHPVRFTAIPMPHAVLTNGPDGRCDGVYRMRQKVEIHKIESIWPKATLGGELEQLKLKDDETTDILEVVMKDYSKPNVEQYTHCAVCKRTKQKLFESKLVGLGSNPFIVFRWSKAPGEDYGRGPLVNVLSAIKTTNLTVQLILENAQMAISGMYQMDDDGVVNPHTISIQPGTIIPRAPGSRGMEPISAAGDFNVSQLILGDMRNNIKEGLYNQMLGDPNRTPATATEVAERMADLSRRIGSSFGRLQAELVEPLLQRVVYILKKQGRIELPTVNGREVKIKSVSPLAQAQANQDISSVARFLELVGGMFGPEALQLLIDSEETSVYLAKKFGVPDNLVRDKADREKLVNMLTEAQNAAQMQQAGESMNGQAVQ